MLLYCIFVHVCIFLCSGGLYDEAYVQKIIDRADAVESKGEKLSASLPASGSDDISILAMQRLYDQYVVLCFLFFDELYTHGLTNHIRCKLN